VTLLRMQLDPYRSRRMDRNDPKTGYSQWLSQREMASNNETSLVHQVVYGQSLDAAYKEANQNDSFYFGLNGRIQERQQSKIPVAGEGAVTFFSALNNVMSVASKLFPLFLPVKALAKLTEQVAREKSGIND